MDMEAAGMMSVANFRKVAFGQILYAGDDLSGSEWDSREWANKKEIRESLFWLGVDVALSL